MSFRDSLLRVLCCFALLLGGICTAPGSAWSQDQSERDEAPDPALHGRWAVGIQVLPIAGPSVRYAVTQRFVVQAAGIPAMFREKGFQGLVGGRLLYRFVDRDTYNAFASIAVSTIFDRAVETGLDGETTSKLETNPFGAATVGLEGTLGSHLGLSGEIGAGWLSVGEISATQLTFGIGLHYYW